MCVEDVIQDPSEPFFPHLLFLAANINASDPFVTNTLKHLIRNADFMACVRRCSLFDLREKEHEGCVDASATHWLTMLLWDSTLAVPTVAVEHFQTLVKAKSFLMPVLVWVYVNPELVGNKKQRKRAMMELEKVCLEKVFKPLQSSAVWRLEIFGLEKEGRKHFNRGLSWLKQQVTFSASKELDSALVAPALTQSIQQPSLHQMSSTTVTPTVIFASQGDSANRPPRAAASQNDKPFFPSSSAALDSRIKPKPLSPSSKLQLIGYSYECESANLNYGNVIAKDSLVLTDPITRDVQSLSETALRKAAVQSHHPPGAFTTDADREAAVQRRRMQRTLNATEAEIARLFRQRIGTTSRSFRSVRFADTSEEFSTVSSFHDNGSVITVTSGMSGANGTISAANDGSFFSTENASSFILAGRGIEYSGGQINILQVPSVVPDPSVQLTETTPTRSDVVEVPTTTESTFDTNPDVHCDVSPTDRNFSVQNVYRPADAARAHVHFESAAEMRVNVNC